MSKPYITLYERSRELTLTWSFPQPCTPPVTPSVASSHPHSFPLWRLLILDLWPRGNLLSQPWPLSFSSQLFMPGGSPLAIIIPIVWGPRTTIWIPVNWHALAGYKWAEWEGSLAAWESPLDYLCGLIILLNLKNSMKVLCHCDTNTWGHGC